MTKHTEGPWMIEPQQGNATGLWIYVNQYDYVALVCGGNKNKEENEANAYLIAAAPELLKACIALQMEDRARNCRLKIADDAIAKAMGEG